ncbi:MAG: amino acid ABC transporter permease [Hyphomicrobiales bacterium]
MGDSRPTATPDDDASPKVAWINDPRIRGLVYQVLLIAAIVWLGYEVVTNAATNLARQNIASGFGFLSNTAGFSITQTLIDYSEQSSYGRVFWVGFINTILVAVIGIIFATVVGFVVGIARLSKNWVISRLATAYVEVLRNIPLLLQLFFWYFAVLRTVPNPRQSIDIGGLLFLNNRGLFSPRPLFEDGAGIIGIIFLLALAASLILRRIARQRQEATGKRLPVLWISLGLMVGLPLIAFFALGMPIGVEMPELKGFNFVGGMRIIPELVGLVLALSIYTAAFIAEIVRAGILAVSHGQTEAAYSLGLKPSPTLRLVIIPQAMRVIIPPLTSQYLNLTKNSSLAVAIAYPDLVSVFAGTVLNQTGQAVEVLLITMLVYLGLSLVTSLFMNWYNARMALVER